MCEGMDGFKHDTGPCGIAAPRNSFHYLFKFNVNLCVKMLFYLNSYLHIFFNSTDPDFVSGLQHHFERRKLVDENIEDVYDGTLYKDHFLPGGFLAQQLNMSFKLNTDGVAVFKSSKFGVWPLFLSINELPPHLR